MIDFTAYWKVTVLNYSMRAEGGKYKKECSDKNVTNWHLIGAGPPSYVGYSQILAAILVSLLLR